MFEGENKKDSTRPNELMPIESLAPLELAPDMEILRRHAIRLAQLAPTKPPSNYKEFIEDLGRKNPDAEVEVFDDPEAPYTITDINLSAGSAIRRDDDEMFIATDMDVGEETGNPNVISPRAEESHQLFFGAVIKVDSKTNPVPGSYILNSEENQVKDKGDIQHTVSITRYFIPDKDGKLRFIRSEEWYEQSLIERGSGGNGDSLRFLSSTIVERDCHGNLLNAESDDEDYLTGIAVTKDKQILKAKQQKGDVSAIAYYLDGEEITEADYENRLAEAEAHMDTALEESIEL